MRQYKKVIVLGFDGLEPSLVDEPCPSERLSHFAPLRQSGSYDRVALPLFLSTAPDSRSGTGQDGGAGCAGMPRRLDVDPDHPPFPIRATEEYSSRLQGLGYI